jgi:site-specific DNA-cytosine methylase
MENIKWSTIIPLIGGSAIGCFKATKKKPEYHLSYSAFNANEKYLTDYWKDVPRIVLDEGGKIPSGEIDFINSVCPCAGLSQLNTSRSIQKREEKNYWMYESSNRVLGDVRPRVYWGENAPGLFTNSGAYVRDKLKELALKYGYTFSLYKTDTQKHGIPQRRVRTFYFFWRDSNPPVLNYFNKPMPRFADYIREIPKSASLQDKFNIDGKISDNFDSYAFILQHLNVTHDSFVKNNDGGAIHSVYSYLAENNLLKECINWIEKNNLEETAEHRRIKAIYKKVQSGGRFMDASPGYYYNRTNAIVGRTLTHLVHPLEDRGMSVRELLHMMGLPHDFEMPDRKNLNAIAQNVPTCTSKDMATQVVEYLNGNLKASNESFLMQDNLKKEVVLCERL